MPLANDVVDANADWETRLRTLQADWAGEDPYWQGYSVFAPVIQLRLLIADLAIRAYEMQHGKLPATLDDLVPEFLPAIPPASTVCGHLVYRKRMMVTEFTSPVLMGTMTAAGPGRTTILTGTLQRSCIFHRAGAPRRGQ